MMWIWWLLVIGVVVIIFRRMTGVGDKRDTRHDSPEETLKRRYANGDIDRDEYDRRLADLRK